MREATEKKLDLVEEPAFDAYRACRLCPRACGVDRTGRGSGPGPGFCRETHRPRAAYIGPHFGEEPPITGERGSGTLFFSGCSLRCSFCQNHQLSHGGMGEEMTLQGMLGALEGMIRREKVHNINFVSPDHFFPHVFRLVSLLRERGVALPVVFNLSGYQSGAALEEAEPYVDIYLPDYKYSDPLLSSRLSGCRDYPGIALDAISRMVSQKGFIDSAEREGLAARGVLVRHLILPGHVENSIDALSSLLLEFGRGLPLSLMAQYCPVLPQKEESLNRPLWRQEFERVYSHALSLGFEHLFVQFPEEVREGVPSPFVPDFRKRRPFGP